MKTVDNAHVHPTHKLKEFFANNGNGKALEPDFLQKVRERNKVPEAVK